MREELTRGGIPQDFAILVEEISFDPSTDHLELGRPSEWSGRPYTLIASSLSEAIDNVLNLISQDAGKPISSVCLRAIDPADAYSGIFRARARAGLNQAV